jgi:hypothetical protein
LYAGVTEIEPLEEAMARTSSFFIISVLSLQFCNSAQAQDAQSQLPYRQHQVSGGGGYGGAGPQRQVGRPQVSGWGGYGGAAPQRPVGQHQVAGWGGYGGGGPQRPVGHYQVPGGGYGGYGGAGPQNQVGRYQVPGGGYGGYGGGYGGYASPPPVPVVIYAPDPDGARESKLCAHLRWTCEHKEELGLEGAGTCGRYKETCD